MAERERERETERGTEKDRDKERERVREGGRVCIGVREREKTREEMGRRWVEEKQ